MPTIDRKETKDGKAYYRIRYKGGRDLPEKSMRWYVPYGWSQKAIDRELPKIAAEFERQCKAGEKITLKEQKQREQEEAAAQAAILTIDRYWKEYFMPQKSITLAEHSRDSFERNFKNHISPVIGQKRITDVTSADITKLLTDFQASGHAHSSCVKVYGILNIVFKAAYMTELIEKNPMDRVQRPKARKDEMKPSSPDAYTAQELRYILQCLQQEPLKWQCLIRLLIVTGMRRGECCGLQWADVDFTNCTVKIERTAGYTKECGIYTNSPKNGRTRTVDVDPAVIALLQRLRIEQSEKCLSSFIFSQDGKNEPLHPDSPTRYLDKFGKRYKLEDCHPHKLRHSFASVALADGGADVVSVSEILGHSDTAVTLRVYAHASEESRKRASSAFRKALEK